MGISGARDAHPLLIARKEIFTRKEILTICWIRLERKSSLRTSPLVCRVIFLSISRAFEKNLKAYLAELDNWIARWEKMAAPLRGVKYVEYHPEWIYLADRFGMKGVGSIELKPGIEPTPNHHSGVGAADQTGESPVAYLWCSESTSSPADRNETGIKVLRLYSGGGGRPETDTYIKWIDYTVRTLVAVRQLEGMELGQDIDEIQSARGGASKDESLPLVSLQNVSLGL